MVYRSKWPQVNSSGTVTFGKLVVDWLRQEFGMDWNDCYDDVMIVEWPVTSHMSVQLVGFIMHSCKYPYQFVNCSLSLSLSLSHTLSPSPLPSLLPQIDQGPAASSFESPSKVGWLYKHGGSGVSSHWRKRWFVADHHYLFYYKGPNVSFADSAF